MIGDQYAADKYLDFLFNKALRNNSMCIYVSLLTGVNVSEN